MNPCNRTAMTLMVSASMLGSACQRIQNEAPAPSKPSEVNRRVSFTASDGKVYFLDAVTGQRTWSHPIEATLPYFLEPVFRGKTMYLPIAGGNLLTIDTAAKAVASRSSGMRITTPLNFAEGLLLFGDLTARSRYAYLGAMDSTGTIKWGFSEGEGVQVGPAVQNNVAYVGNYSGILYAVDVSTGKKRWEMSLGNSEFKSDLVVGAGQLFVYPVTFSNGSPGPGKLYAYDLTSRTPSWEFPIAPVDFPLNTYSALTFDRMKEVLYAISGDGKLYALDPRTGAKKWHFAAGDGFARCPAVADNAVFVGGRDGKLYALDAQTGQKKWDFTTGGPVSTTPTVVNGVVFFGSEDKKCYAVDATTGTKNWEGLLDGVINTTPVVWTSKNRHVGFHERGGQATN